MEVDCRGLRGTVARASIASRCSIADRCRALADLIADALGAIDHQAVGVAGYSVGAGKVDFIGCRVRAGHDHIARLIRRSGGSTGYRAEINRTSRAAGVDVAASGHGNLNCEGGASCCAGQRGASRYNSQGCGSGDTTQILGKLL